MPEIDWVAKIQQSVKVVDFIRIATFWQLVEGELVDILDYALQIKNGAITSLIAYEDISDIRKLVEVFNRRNLPLECIDSIIYLEGQESFACVCGKSQIPTDGEPHVCPYCGQQYAAKEEASE